MEKKKIYFISSVIILALLLIIILFLFKKDAQENVVVDIYNPEFLSEEQKRELGFPLDREAQFFYDEDGQLVYKMIEEQSDIVLNPEEYGLKR